MKNKWVLLGFLCATFVVYTLDRALLGPLAIPIQKDTGISDVEFGVLNAAVFWTYAAVVPFAGIIGDRFNRAKLIGIASVVWSVMTLLAGFSTGFWSLFLLVAFAITAPQTLYSPSAFAMIADTHRETRAIAMSCHQAAFYTGWLVSGAAVAGVLAWCGSWRWAYFIFGTVGLTLGLVFAFAARGYGGPRTSADATAARPAASKASVRESLKAFFCCPSALFAALAHVSFTFVAFGYTAWGPKFVAQKFSISPGAAGTGVMFWHFVFAFGAIIFAGFLTDRMVRSFPRFRLALQSAALLAAAPFLALFGFTSTLTTVWAAAALFGVMKGLFEANSVNSLYDVIPARCRASAIGYLNVLAGTLGSLAPVILGWLSQTRGNEGLAIGFASFGGVLAAASLLLVFSLLFTFRRDRIKEG